MRKKPGGNLDKNRGIYNISLQKENVKELLRSPPDSPVRYFSATFKIPVSDP
jgi:hypothetical protein